MAGGSSFGTQLKAILIRNFLLKLRGRKHTLVEMIMPLYFLLILIFVRFGIPVSNLPALTTPQTVFSVEDLSALTNATVGFVGGQEDRGISIDLQSQLRRVNGVVLNFDSEQELLDYMDKNDSSVISFAVVLGNHTEEDISYTLRPMPEMELPDLDTLYVTEDKCHPKWSDDPDQFESNEMATSCPARKYYDVGFIQLQSLVDTSLIRNRTNVTVDQPVSINVSVVVFPKPAFKGNTEYLRSFVPLYMAIAFTPFVAYLCILIVGEKERKIKDAMKLMGLKSPVYWLGWMITYGVLVVVLSIISTVLLVVAEITPHANVLLLFILITLYGFSTITISFLATPFFTSAKAAGGFASVASSLFSCLYYVAVYAEGVPTSVYYALSLLSPTAFALGMDKVVYLDLVDDGIGFDNFWQEGFCFGSSIIMLAVDVVLYGVLAYYFDNVIPGEYGRKRPPWFFFMPSFWCPKPTKNTLLAKAASIADEENENFEKVSGDFIGKEALRIFNISKVFNGCRSPQSVAVDGISLDLYEGQITAILGHNGAGKTTLLNMLVGLTTPTSGTASIYGLDISDANNFEAIWNQIGICLQQDVLFDELTPKHHLEFFGRIKGIPEKKLKLKVEEILKDVDLTDRKDAPAGKISGGQKRKLSIGIALIGDPKIVILDEPTSGVDPYSRRHLWNLLQNNKKNRLIILTTHFMDEADILADRKAIVSHGKVKCVGSSLFLKNKFGLGYHLTMVVENRFDEKAISELIDAHIEDGKKVRGNASELAYRLPFDQVGKFPALLAVLDQAVLKKGPNANVGLKSYGISMTTLEEVFLKLGDDDAEQARASFSSYNDHGNHRLQSSDGEEFAVARALDGVHIEYNWLQAFLYMMKMNLVAVLRLPRQIISTVVVPIILLVVTFYLMTISTTEDDIIDPVRLGYSMYPNYSVLYTNDTDGDNLDPLLNQFENLGIACTDFPDNFSALLEVPPHTFYLNITQFDATLLRLSLEAAYNDTAQHSLPIIMNMLSNALMGIVSEANAEPSVPIEMFSEPLPRHTVPVAFSGSTMGAVLMIGFAYTMMTAVYSADAVEDRETKVKHQLQVSGMPFSVYWFSKFCANFMLFAIALVATIVIIEAFRVDPFKGGASLGILVLAYVLYMITGLFFGYCFSFAFKKYETAQSFLPICFMILGFVPYMVICLTDMLVPDNGQTAKVMHYIFTILLPIYSPYSIMYYLDKVYTTSQWTGDELSGTDYFTEEVIVTLVALPIQALVFLGMLWVLDFRSGNGQWSEILDACRPKRDEVTGYDPLRDNNDIPENEDEDVTEERRRVQQLGETTAANRTSVVVMQGLRKEFATKKTSPLKNCLKKKKKKAPSGVKVAVRNLTFSVEKAEVFGLLGPNGAGKTTALRTIVADEIPSKGKVTVAGFDMAMDLKKAIRNIGYCPQHDALWKSVTVREHLECYANIRGVKRSMIPRMTQALMDGLRIAEHADKRTEHLSGGTKRKLSYAISMLGDPKIVLLDEPSTGMDPQSKRYLWDTIMANFQGERGAILTTHSMEEADFLCGRVGIMVKGQLVCIGSTQHLKNKYGSGYTLEAKVLAGEQRNRMLDDLDKDIKRIFKGATVHERFEDRVKYHIPQTGDITLAEIFTKLEEVKTKYGVEEYSFSQTTLEQVFLEFAKQQEFESRDEEEKSTDF